MIALIATETLNRETFIIVYHSLNRSVNVLASEAPVPKHAVIGLPVPAWFAF
jgi:hypothetical protein